MYLTCCTEKPSDCKTVKHLKHPGMLGTQSVRFLNSEVQ